MNKNKIKTPYKRFLSIGMAEGLSFLILVFVAMPLKYFYGFSEAVRIVGLIHGVLFIGFVTVLIFVTNFYGWKVKIVLLSFLLSLLPFGTFWLKKITQDAV